jgi:hypothetical protein
VGVARRRPAPQDLPVRRVDREGDPVRRRDEEGVVRRAADRDAVQVDRRGVGRARQMNLLANERADVRGCDPGRVRIVARAPRVPTEARPVLARSRDRLVRAGDAARFPAAATRGEEEPESDESRYRRSRTRRNSSSLPGSRMAST